MSRAPARPAAALLLAVLLFAPRLVATDLPKWLSFAVSQTPDTPPRAPALVLVNDTSLSIENAGTATRVHRYAVKIYNHAGLAEAVGAAFYLEKSDRVTNAEAWLVRNGKVVKSLRGDKWFDLAAGGAGVIYSEERIREAVCTDEAAPGDVFGFETVVEGSMLFAQDAYSWDERLPELVDRFTVSVPAGWTVTPFVHGRSKPLASVSADGRTLAWEVRDLPYQPDEPWSDDYNVTVADVMLNFAPPANSRNAAFRFPGWSQVADWDDRLTSGQCDSDATLVAKVKQLTADCPDELAKIRALTTYVQKLRYVSVNQKLARGFGYQPRKASEVFAKGFGDCKDKSNLLRAMLREAGIPSYLVSALSSESRRVSPDWPSPMQFNHAILAIKVDAKTDLPTVVATKAWGPLLFFDSTDDETVVGDLPWYLQGSYVQVIAPGSDELVKLPELPIERRWLAERHMQLKLAPSGTASGDCQLTTYEQLGADVRRTVHRLESRDFSKWASSRLGNGLHGVQVQNVTFKENAVDRNYRIDFHIPDTPFAQPLPGGMSVVRFDVLNREGVPVFAENARWTPVLEQPVILDDVITLELPAGTVPDEIPQGSKVKGPFGSYESSFAVDGGKIIFRRRLALVGRSVAADDYPKLRQFLAEVTKADRAGVVIRSSQQ